MNVSFILLFCSISLFNVIMQTVKSLCTVRCSTFVAACVNALTYAVYVYVIVYTNADGLTLWGKALITAGANFVGVYIANFIFKKVFSNTVGWVVSVSVPSTFDEDVSFALKMDQNNLTFHNYGTNSDGNFVLFDVYCNTKEQSAILKKILPANSVYHIAENRKRL